MLLLLWKAPVRLWLGKRPWRTTVTLLNQLRFASLLCSAFIVGQVRAEEGQALAWLKLLHYQKGFFGYKSTIDYSGFFFASDGKVNPNAELAASRLALQTGEPKVGPYQLDPQCAFPARSIYFQEAFGDVPRAVVCDGFEHWREHLQVKSLSLVFSSAYLGNPASMLGHTFLKLNLKEKQGGLSPLLDYGASFSAYPDDALGVIYFIKGLTGGYPGVFNIEPYYTHLLSYSYKENRDLWEYELDLSARELDLFLAHFWELFSSSAVDYYFLDDNCASMLIEVLDAVRPDLDLTAKKELFVLPQQTLKVALRLQKEKRVKIYPSQRRQFQSALERLNSSEKSELEETLAGHSLAGNPAVLDLAIGHINLQKADLKWEEQEKLRDLEDAILLKRSKYASSPKMHDSSDVYDSPDLAHEPPKVSVGFGSGKRTEMRARVGHHDLIDPPAGFDPYYHMNYFDLRLSKNEETAYNLDFTLIEVKSLVPLREFDNFPSWRFAAGARLREPKEGKNQRNIFLEAGGGLAYELVAKKLLIFSMPGIAASVPGVRENALALEGNVSLFWAPLPKLRLLLTRKLRMPLDPNREIVRHVALGQAAWDLSQSWSVEWEGQALHESYALMRLAYRF